MICNLSICTSDESFTAIPIFESCTSTLLEAFTNDCSPIEKALSLQVSKTASVILTLLAEISTQSFNEFSILIFFMFKSEKSMSKESNLVFYNNNTRYIAGRIHYIYCIFTI